MKPLENRLFKRFASDRVAGEIEEELRFHLDLLTEEQLPQQPSLAAAQKAALKRFGDVDRIKDQCVAISQRRRPLIVALKSFLVAVFLGGVLLRVSSLELHVARIGDILIFVGVMGRLLLYLRGLNPSGARRRPDTTPLLMLNDSPTITPYDHRRLTPLERVISDE